MTHRLQEVRGLGQGSGMHERQWFAASLGVRVLFWSYIRPITVHVAHFQYLHSKIWAQLPGLLL